MLRAFPDVLLYCLRLRCYVYLHRPVVVTRGYGAARVWMSEREPLPQQSLIPLTLRKSRCEQSRFVSLFVNRDLFRLSMVYARVPTPSSPSTNNSCVSPSCFEADESGPGVSARVSTLWPRL